MRALQRISQLLNLFQNCQDNEQKYIYEGDIHSLSMELAANANVWVNVDVDKSTEDKIVFYMTMCVDKKMSTVAFQATEQGVVVLDGEGFRKFLCNIINEEINTP